MKTPKEKAAGERRQCSAKGFESKAKDKKAKGQTPQKQTPNAATTRDAAKSGKSAKHNKSLGAVKSPGGISSVPASIAQNSDSNSGSDMSGGCSSERLTAPSGYDVEVLLRMVADVQNGCIRPAELPALLQKMRAATVLLKNLDACDTCPGSVDWKGAATAASLPLDTIVSEAWKFAALEARETFNSILRQVLHALLDVIKNGNGNQAKWSLQILIDGLLEILNEIAVLMEDDRKRPLFQNIAKHRLQFPSLLSVYAMQNSKVANFILETLGLGGVLPFTPDPRQAYTPYNALAIQIVAWIDAERSSNASVYQRVVPNLGEFCSANSAAWEKAVGFHLDYFQSPGEVRWRRWVSEYGLEDCREAGDADGLTAEVRFRQTELRNVGQNQGPIGDVTEMAHFKEILISGRDRNATSAATLYNRVKNKVLDIVRVHIGRSRTSIPE